MKYPVARNSRLVRFATLILGIYLLAINFQVFLKPLGIMAGGTNTVALVLEFYHIPSIWTIVLVSLALLLISFWGLGKQETRPFLLATLLYPIFVELTAPLVSFFPLEPENYLVYLLFAGMIQGFATGLIFKIGASPSGFAILSKIGYVRSHISISKSNFWINACLLGIGSFYLGLDSLLASILVLYLSMIVTDKVLLGSNRNKLFYIVTSKEKAVKHFLEKELKCGTTKLEGTSTLGSTVLFCVLSTHQYFVLKEALLLLDPEAFFLITNAYEVSGGV